MHTRLHVYICTFVQVLKNSEMIAKILEPIDVQGHTYSTQNNVQTILTLLTLISNIQKLMYKSRPLCEHECTYFKQQVEQLLQHIITSFPNRRLTPKLHMLTHISHFLDMYNTIGMFGEHAGEHIHHIFNNIYNMYIHSPFPKHQRLEQMLNKQHQWSHGARLSQ